jgi:GNAT superfamily N-acetyltransferase
MAIAPLKAAHLPEVARLLVDQEAGKLERRSERVAAYFGDLYLKAPYVDPRFPSLVAVDEDGTVEGFLGVIPGRLRYRGRTLRSAASGPLLVRADRRSRALGGFLVRAFLSGAQDLSLSDGCNERARPLFESLGAEVVGLPSMRWVRPLRPFRAAGWLMSYRFGTGTAPARLLGGFDTLAARRLIPKKVDTRATPLDGERLAEALTTFDDEVLVPDDDPEIIDWKFEHMAATTAKGTLRRFIVNDRTGRLLGWCVYHLQPDGVCRVVQIGRHPRSTGPVFAHLLRDAYDGGGGVLYGRFEPHIRAELRNQPIVVRPWSPLMVIHSDQPDLRLAVHGGHALLSRLEGENWTGIFHQPLP